MPGDDGAAGEDRSVLTRDAREPDERMALGSQTHADIYRSRRRARGLVICVHGGFWRPEYDSTHLRPMAQALADEGWDAALLEYPRIPGDPDATTSAVASGSRRLISHARGSRVVVVGHSAGGHLALWLAQAELRDRGAGIDAIVALAPVADLESAHLAGLDEGAVEHFLGGPTGPRADLDPARLPPTNIPLVVLHGTRDARVPLDHSIGYLARLGQQERLRILDGADHFALIDPLSAAWPVVLEAVSET